MSYTNDIKFQKEIERMNELQKEYENLLTRIDKAPK